MNFSVSHPYWVMLDKILSPSCKIWSFLKLEEMIIQHISKIDELVINEGALSVRSARLHQMQFEDTKVTKPKKIIARCQKGISEVCV